MILEVNNVSVVYPDGNDKVTALDNVSMTADAGEFTAIVGESGSGKSTLLSVAAGLQKPDSGTVHIDGGEIDSRKIGMIFQSPNLLAALSVREQLTLINHIRHEPLDNERADRLLATVGIDGTRRTHQLSGGQRQRVNIARALMGEPKLLLADEPTSALDHELSEEIVGLLRRITDELGVATVMVTHDRSQLDAVDKVITMSDGKVVTKVGA